MKSLQELLLCVEDDMELFGLSHIIYLMEKDGHTVDYDYLPSELYTEAVTLKELQDELLQRRMLESVAAPSAAGKDDTPAKKLAVLFPGIGYTCDKPLLYYSGECVRAFVDYYKVDPEEDVIIVYDDITLEPGSIRVRKKGSAGGHNGIKSIIAHLGTEKFKRIRVGVGEKPANWDLADFVLAPFKGEDKEAAQEGVELAAKAVRVILEEGADAAMNQFNKKAKK